MLRELAEKADKELQELQANLEQGSDRESGPPLQQRLIDSWQGKVPPSPSVGLRESSNAIA